MSSSTLSHYYYHHQLGDVSKKMKILLVEFECVIYFSEVVLPSSSTSKRKWFKGMSVHVLFSLNTYFKCMIIFLLHNHCLSFRNIPPVLSLIFFAVEQYNILKCCQ